MAQDATLHIKLDSEMDQKLKYLAKTRGKSKGQLVRDALSTCYQVSDLPLHQNQALAAYQGGYISLSKLARVMGMHALQLRQWLQEHAISQNSAYADEDTANA
jgi:predicted DNA-binding protein